MFKAFSLFIFAFFALASNAFSFAYNNISADPSISLYSLAAHNDSAFKQSKNYRFANIYAEIPVDAILSDNSSLCFLPFFYSSKNNTQEDFSKASFANAFVEFYKGPLSLTIGRQFYFNEDTSFALYFGPDNNFYDDAPSYLDGLSAALNTELFALKILLANDGRNIAAIDAKTQMFSFLSLAAFSYYKAVAQGNLYIFGGGLNFALEPNMEGAAIFAYNYGSQQYSVYNLSRTNDFRGSFFLFKLQREYFEWLSVKLALADVSKNGFEPISRYNIYGEIAGNIFNFSTRSIRTTFEFTPTNNPHIILAMDYFVYLSAFKDSYGRLLGKELNLRAGLEGKNIAVRLSYAYLDIDRNFAADATPLNNTENRHIHSLSLKMILKNVF